MSFSSYFSSASLNDFCPKMVQPFLSSNHQFSVQLYYQNNCKSLYIMDGQHSIKDRGCLQITQISSINIFEPSPNTLPSGLLYDQNCNHNNPHQQRIRKSDYPPSGQSRQLIVADEPPLRMQGGKVDKIDRKVQIWEMAPPSIEHIVIENQLSEQQRLPQFNGQRIMDIFAGKQTLSSDVFPTQKSSLGREGAVKAHSRRESTKTVDKGSSVEAVAQCLQMEGQIASLKAQNNKIHTLLTTLSQHSKTTQHLNYNSIDPFYVKALIQQQLRARGVSIAK